MGMLGKDVQHRMNDNNHEVIATDIRECDVTMDICDSRQIEAALDKHHPDIIIHCAAWTRVDEAESHADAAWRANAIGSHLLAEASGKRDIPVIAISTDFVFNGKKGDAYTEFDNADPLSVYGASKYAGEMSVRQFCRRHWIVRTSWLFGLHGKCFPDTMLRIGSKWQPGDNPIRVVADQMGTPTWTYDLAGFLVSIVNDELPCGVWHYANRGTVSWYNFARTILNLGGFGYVPVMPITSADWPAPAPSPANSALRPFMIEMLGLPLPPAWEISLQNYLQLKKMDTVY
jgi:dTDP-4-dehydrorhamnose reductase